MINVEMNWNAFELHTNYRLKIRKRIPQRAQIEKMVQSAFRFFVFFVCMLTVRAIEKCLFTGRKTGAHRHCCRMNFSKNLNKERVKGKFYWWFFFLHFFIQIYGLCLYYFKHRLTNDFLVVVCFGRRKIRNNIMEKMLQADRSF